MNPRSADAPPAGAASVACATGGMQEGEAGRGVALAACCARPGCRCPPCTLADATRRFQRALDLQPGRHRPAPLDR